MLLKVTLRDRDAGSGGSVRRAQVLELEAEAGCEAELLGALAVLLTTIGPTTAAAVRELVARATPKLELD